MVNYGYDCEGWDATSKFRLAHRLKVLLLRMGYNIKPDCDNPYVEVDNLYSGVRIRKITYLSDEQEAELISKADEIYREEEKLRKK